MVTVTPAEKTLNELMDRLSDLVDPARCHEKDERYIKTFAYGTVDRPPLVAILNNISSYSFPAPWDRFRFHDYRVAFDDPAAMMHNMLMERVLPGMLIGDDSPFAIRNNHGTVQMVAYLGGIWELHGNDYPWARPFDTVDRIREITKERHLFDKTRGIIRKSLDTLDYYREKLNQYPALKETVQVSMPDLQGPFDTAEQLWGSRIFYAFYDEPDLLEAFLARIVDATADVAEEFCRHTFDRMDPAANAQHEYAVPGRLLIRNDTSIMLSPDLYEQFVLPADAALLKRIGKGSIHFCGNGQHLVESMLRMTDLMGLDFGNPDYMDMEAISRMCREKNVSMTNVISTREDLMSGKAIRDIPTGVVFTYYTDSLEDAKAVMEKYIHMSKQN